MARYTPETKVAIFFPPHLMKKACVLTQALQAEAKFLLQDGSSCVLKFRDRSLSLLILSPQNLKLELLHHVKLWDYFLSDER